MRLLGRTGKLRGQTVAVTGTMRLGRGPENQLQVMADGVSRRHAQIVSDDTGVWLEDLGSANGTLLNGQIIKRERLEHLDIITLAPGADLIVDTRRSSEVAVTTRMARPWTIFLQPLDGPQEGGRIDIKPGELMIGRTAPAAVLVENAAVSKVHARLRRTANNVILEDFQSANGTFVNGERVTEAVTLKDGDRISIAGLRSFRVSISVPEGAEPTVASAPTAAAPPAEAGAKRESFDQEWRTKLEWSPEELAALDAERARVVAEIAEAGAAAASAQPSRVPVPPPPAPGTQFYSDLPMPPGLKPTPQAPPAPAPKTQHFSSMPTPPAMPIPPPSAPKTPVAAAPEARTQHFDSPPTPPVMPPSAPVAPATPASPAAPRTQLYNAAPEPPSMAPPVPPAAPAPPTVKPAPRPSPPPSEVPTQKFDPSMLPTLSGAPPAPAPARASRVLTLRGTASEFVLKEGIHTVGRQESCGVAVLDRQVSRTHAILTLTPSSLSVEDKGSANGTFVNGKRVSGTSPLRHGDTLSFGGVEFTVELQT